MNLFESANAVADANGRAVASLQPLRSFELWKIKRMTVQSTSTTLVPTCKIYRGAETASALVDGTHTGTLDHSDTDMQLRNGEALLAVWEGGDVGSTCTITIEGDSLR